MATARRQASVLAITGRLVEWSSGQHFRERADVDIMAHGHELPFESRRPAVNILRLAGAPRRRCHDKAF